MTDKFKLSFDGLGKSNKPEDKKEEAPSAEIQIYDMPNNARNLCFVLKDGKSIFLNYAYLIFGEYSSEDNAISLFFTSHSITLKGHALEGLFNDLTSHMPKQIKCVEKRYVEALNTSESLVTEINIKENTR